MRTDEPIAVAGAGIAGLTAALALARFGFRVEVFEQAEALGEVGAGLQLSPNALSVLARLGILDSIGARAVAADHVTLRRGRDGRTIANVPVRGSDGTPYLSLHRGALHAALAAAARAEPRVSLHLGRAVTYVRDADRGVELNFAYGSPTRATCLLAADGVHSRVAASGGLPAAGETGSIAWRMTLSRSEAGSLPEGINAWLGAARHAVAYPIEAGEALNLVLIDGFDGTSPPTDPRAYLLRRFAGWDQRLLDWIARAPAPTPWPIRAAPAERPYQLGSGALLIGDAAHAMAPYAAQGAALAIEDAFVAAALLAERGDAPAAFAAFEAERRPRVDAVRRRVAFHRLVYHLPRPAADARDLALRLQPKAALARSLAWLYDWTPRGPA